MNELKLKKKSLNSFYNLRKNQKRKINLFLAANNYYIIELFCVEEVLEEFYLVDKSPFVMLPFQLASLIPS